MEETRWDIKRGSSVYHQVSDARFKLWIKSGKIKAGEVIVWHANLSGWRRPEELEGLQPSFEHYKKSLLRKSEKFRPAGASGPGIKKISGILLIDDEKDLCSLLGNSLSTRGFRMECAHTKREALKCLKRRLPDLVLLDLRLPDAEGLALLSLIRKTDPAPVVFVTTAFGSEDIRSQAKKLGARGFLDKPYNEEDVIRKIRELRNPEDAGGESEAGKTG